MIRRALRVPLLTLLSAALLTAHLSFGADIYRDCAYVGPSTRMYLTSWAALACALGALPAFAGLPRSERRGLALLSVVAAVLLTLATVTTTYWLYAPDPAGGADCSGLARPVTPWTAH
ncbi:hypothetical protein FRZ03_36435 [Streptomyces misionensis]|uniref:DUF998 domain-containing protein n=1 Tax=Streptomyces misionensis TaxID=67331 RepID=A0A5C6IQA1_9ACTN|nr:hypothetical protein [Streptomyces misionensis]TWV30683.1 hypothetical protein FRZ03_36435 [Streptomyces misionensis]